MVIYVTRGLPASSKTTWAKEAAEYPDTVRVCRDDIRDMLVGTDRPGVLSPELEATVSRMEEAAVKAEAQVEALREAAEAFDMATVNVEIFGDSEDARLWQDRNSQRKQSVLSLHDRADRIAREAGIETGASND